MAKLGRKYSVPIYSTHAQTPPPPIINIPTRVAHLVQVINPQFHITSQSPFALQLTLGAAHSMGLDRCIMTCPSSWHHTEQFHGPQSPLCSTHSSFSPQNPLATTDLFTISTVLPFPKWHAVGIIQCEAFLDWLVSLSHMHLRFLRAE